MIVIINKYLCWSYYNKLYKYLIINSVFYQKLCFYLVVNLISMQFMTLLYIIVKYFYNKIGLGTNMQI